MENFQAFFECLRGMVLKVHSMDALLNALSVFPGHPLIKGMPFLSLSLFFEGAIQGTQGIMSLQGEV